MGKKVRRGKEVGCGVVECRELDREGSGVGDG